MTYIEPTTPRDKGIFFLYHLKSNDLHACHAIFTRHELHKQQKKELLNTDWLALMNDCSALSRGLHVQQSIPSKLISSQQLTPIVRQVDVV